jgi:hypothetical protein
MLILRTNHLRINKTMNIEIRPLAAEDYEHVTTLWASAESIGLHDGETLASLRRFLSHNDGLSLGAWSAGCLLGAVMVGHDTRRAYLYHFAVAADRRRALAAEWPRLFTAGCATSVLAKPICSCSQTMRWRCASEKRWAGRAAGT